MAVKPLVSVVTPAYNGAEYLAECIDSVLDQDYENWEYVIVNNCSSDSTLEIAQDYARRDRRIRVHDNEEFLNVVANWNNSIRQASPESKYCKVVHADDRLMPNCVSAMVEIAERSDRIGLVGSRFVRGSATFPGRPPFDTDVVDGADASRTYFRMFRNFFGTPSNILIRSALIRARPTFHNEANLHSSDLEAWLEVLRSHSLGYIRDVLTYSRHHKGSLTTVTKRYRIGELSRLYLLSRYGREVLPPEEFNRVFFRKLYAYERLLLRALAGGDLELYRYHRQHLERLGYEPLADGGSALLRLLSRRASRAREGLR
jgi:glycosyltransferase involved in cell wall biosynthesis